VTNRRRICTATRTFVVHDLGNGLYEICCEDFHWSVTLAADGDLEVTEAPASDDLPPRLTESMVLAAVRGYSKFHSYSC